MVLDGKALLARFRHPERQAEEPHFAAAYREMGMLYLRRHQPAEAVGVLRKAVRYDPTDGQALFQLGQALIRAGDRKGSW